MSPKWSLAETPVMPKSRYAIMARYMPKVGTRGLDMMFRTATVQVNLDFASERDMVAKMRVGLALQPAIAALFANSPFTDGKLNGLLSARSEIWRQNHRRHQHARLRLRARHGIPALRGYVLDVPLLFRETWRPLSGRGRSQLSRSLAGQLKETPGERATLADWANHLSSIFPRCVSSAS